MGQEKRNQMFRDKPSRDDKEKQLSRHPVASTRTSKRRNIVQLNRAVVEVAVHSKVKKKTTLFDVLVEDASVCDESLNATRII